MKTLLHPFLSISLATTALFLADFARADAGYEADPETIRAFEDAGYNSPTADLSAAGDWKILKTEWSAGDEKRFSEFVTAIAKSGCRTTDECFKSPANPYRSSDARTVKFYSDCADLPYLFRAYFAWKNGLPFGLTTDVAQFKRNPPTPGPDRDIRYSPLGNYPVARMDVRTSSTGVRMNGMRILANLTNQISSAMHRIGPVKDDPRHPTDFYPAALTHEGIRPGTVLYDPAGHVTMVYSREADGRILYIDAHPDNSVTRGTFTKKFVRSNPGMGAGFKNWRPFKLIGATKSPEGDYWGGTLVSARNSELPDYGTVQYYGTNPDPRGVWNKGKFIFGGQVLDYYDYVRRVLADGNLRYDPLREIGLLLKGICNDLRDRVFAVELAISRGISTKAHPSRLPLNIYGAQGEWEDYASPSRDARLKTSFKETYDRTGEFLELWRAGDPSIDYAGADLRKDLASVLETEAAACTISYRKSDGNSKALSLKDAMERAFLLSFDPYACVELRWGATSAEELASCRDDSTKMRWHRALRKIRNQTERTYEAKMDYTVDGLENPSTGGALGLETPPKVDLRELLQ